MSSFRIIQVSDTHLSRERPFFVANWDAAVAHINAARPDLVINSGDIALNGADVEDDLRFSAEQHARLQVPVRTIPGNHDLGDNPASPEDTPKQPIADNRRDRYLAHFADEFWTQDAGDWRLIAMNAQLLGSGLPTEESQWSFLAQAFRDAGQKPIALFLHKPLFKDEPGETNESKHRYVVPTPRQRLLDLAKGTNLKLVACGHVHQHRVFEKDGITHVWAPSTAFILPDSYQPRIGTKEVGLVEYDFDGEDVAVRVVVAEGMQQTNIMDVPGAYGDLSKKMAAAPVLPIPAVAAQ